MANRRTHTTDTSQELYKTKLQLIAVVLVVIGTILVVPGFWLASSNSISDKLSTILLNFGFAVLTTALVAIVFEYLDRKHGEQRTKKGLRQAVRAEAPALSEAFYESLAFNADALKDIASNDLLDRIATNALALRVSDAQLAHDLYTDVRDQVANAPERWRDVKVSVALTPSTSGPAAGRGSMLVATIHWEYRVRSPRTTMRFASASDLGEYRDMLRDQAITSAWYFEPLEGITFDQRETFELLHFSVNGKEKKIRRATRAGAQVYTISLGDQASNDQEVVIGYTYRVLVQRHGHLLYLDLPRPTKGLYIQLDYANAGIKWMNVLDYFASNQQSRIEHRPESATVKNVTVSFDGWALPRSGVAFVWVLEGEQRLSGTKMS